MPLPTAQESARIIAALHELEPKKTMSELAQRIPVPQLFLVNAVKEARKMELFDIDENDKVKMISPLDYTQSNGMSFGEEITYLQDQIVLAIENANSNEQDMDEGQLRHWLLGTQEFAVDVAFKGLENMSYLSSYEMADPADKKSVYKFWTLASNARHQWGQKNFEKKK